MGGWNPVKEPKVLVPKRAQFDRGDGWTSTQLVVPKELDAALRAVAVQLNLSYAEVWRTAAAQFLERYEEVPLG